MAVPSSPPPPSNAAAATATATATTQNNKNNQKQKKRSTCPGVRVVSGRIYDSQNGKTCHQCRQKTMDFTAECKNMKLDKQCTIRFCHKCLLNRYGENAEEMDVLDDWKCPKCRDMCNCSCCMKKKGHKPTGILVHAAKATGFSSVSELLNVKGPNACQEMVVKAAVAPPKKEPKVVSPKKRGKENSPDGTGNTTLKSQSLPSTLDESKKKKAKSEALSERVEVKSNGSVKSPKEDIQEVVLRKSPREDVQEVVPRRSPRKVVQEVVLRRSPRKFATSPKVTEEKEKMKADDSGVPAAETEIVENKPEGQEEKKLRPRKLKTDADIKVNDVEVALPPGTLLTNVCTIDLLPEDIGHGLQFLEFCSTFGEVLEIRKGQPESVLRDIMLGRTRRGKCSATVMFLIQLLAFIMKDMEEESPPLSTTGGEDCWTHSLKKCISVSECVLKDIPEACFDKGCDGFEMLESSQKLKLLIFLCDETLGTIAMRNWINDQNSVFVENAKEAKENLNAAKEKEKTIKRRLQDEVAKAIIEKNGAPLTIAEHDSIIAHIKKESERARAEMLDAINMQPNKKQRSDAVRTEPVFVDDNGRVYWRLKGFKESDILLQDMSGPSDEIFCNEKWYSYDGEQTEDVEKHIASKRTRINWQNKIAVATYIKSISSDNEQDSSSNDDLSPVANDQ